MKITAHDIMIGMAGARCNALAEGRKPLAWRINRSAEMIFMADADFWKQLPPNKTLADVKFFDLPLSIVDDYSSTPTFFLDTAPASGVAISLSIASDGTAAPMEKQG